MSGLHQFHEKHRWLRRVILVLVAAIAILVFARVVNGM